MQDQPMKWKKPLSESIAKFIKMGYPMKLAVTKAMQSSKGKTTKKDSKYAS